MRHPAAAFAKALPSGSWRAAPGRAHYGRPAHQPATPFMGRAPIGSPETRFFSLSGGVSDFHRQSRQSPGGYGVGKAPSRSHSPQEGTVLPYGCYVNSYGGIAFRVELEMIMIMSKFNRIASGTLA